MRRHTPNLLTFLRLALAGLLFALLAGYRYVESPMAFAIPEAAMSAPSLYFDRILLLAAALFSIAAITDGLDGYLARRWKATSDLGRILDPVADKVLVLGAFAFFISPAFALPTPDGGSWQVTGLSTWMFVIILSRELLVTSIRSVCESRGIAFGASFSGKMKMILQSTAIPVTLLALAVSPAADLTNTGATPTRTGYFIASLNALTVAVTAISAIPYLVRATRALPASTAHPAKPS